MSFFADCAKQSAPNPELRVDKNYDEQLPGSVICPNGTVAASLDRGVQGATAKAALDLYDLERLRTLATRAVETYVNVDYEDDAPFDDLDVAMTALGAALGFDLEVRAP